MSAEQQANPEPWTWPPDDGGGRWWRDANGEKVGYDAVAAALEARDRHIAELEAKIEELTKVDDPCPICGERVIPFQRGGTKWSCKNHHVQDRK